MEGLQIAAVLRKLPEPPLETSGWRFPDEGTAVLVLAGAGELVLRYRPPSPSLTLETKAGGGPPRTPFQKLLSARARGPLVGYRQVKLDRVVFFDFGGESGFVDAPPTRLVFELTGRNANLILLGPNGRIIGADRVIGPEVNRYRQVRPGLDYLPPPPYEKLDPRQADYAELKEVLLGQPPLKALVKHVDGIGPQLAREAVRRAGINEKTPLNEDRLRKLASSLKSLVANPQTSEEIVGGWLEETEASLRKPLLAALEHRRTALRRRLEDFERARADAAKAADWQHAGDLILAYAHQIEAGANRVTLADWEGGKRTLELDPALDAPANAERYYRRARRARTRAERAAREKPRVERELAEIEKKLQEVRAASLEELRRMHKELSRQQQTAIGRRLRAPGGFEVWLGRNNKENDLLTRAAHSGDLWFHAQGVPGSHVILRTQGRPAPLEALLYAARLAAYHSKARGEKNAPVDYAQKKHVWRPRKAAPGQVLYTQAKTLFVDASSPPEGDENTEKS
ncbi:Rqc2 family fibronectin-binding protein [Oceanithermus sp.]